MLLEKKTTIILEKGRKTFSTITELKMIKRGKKKLKTIVAATARKDKSFLQKSARSSRKAF